MYIALDFWPKKKGVSMISDHLIPFSFFTITFEAKNTLVFFLSNNLKQ